MPFSKQLTKVPFLSLCYCFLLICFYQILLLSLVHSGREVFEGLGAHGFQEQSIFFYRIFFQGKKKEKEKSLVSDVSSNPDNIGNPLQNTWGENACKQLRLSLLTYTCSGVDKKEIRGLTDPSRQQ